MKFIVARDTLLSYPYFNEPVDIHKYSSDYHILAVIIQKFKPIEFYSHKLTVL